MNEQNSARKENPRNKSEEKAEKKKEFGKKSNLLVEGVVAAFTFATVSSGCTWIVNEMVKKFDGNSDVEEVQDSEGERDIAEDIPGEDIRDIIEDEDAGFDPIEDISWDTDVMDEDVIEEDVDEEDIVVEDIAVEDVEEEDTAVEDIVEEDPAAEDIIDEDISVDIHEDEISDATDEDVVADPGHEDVSGDVIEEDMPEEDTAEEEIVIVCSAFDQIRTVWIYDGSVASIGGVETKYKGTDTSGDAIFDILCGGIAVRSDITAPVGSSTVLDVTEHTFRITLTPYSADSTRTNVNINVDDY